MKKTIIRPTPEPAKRRTTGQPSLRRLILFAVGFVLMFIGVLVLAERNRPVADISQVELLRLLNGAEISGCSPYTYDAAVIKLKSNGLIIVERTTLPIYAGKYQFVNGLVIPSKHDAILDLYVSVLCGDFGMIKN